MLSFNEKMAYGAGAFGKEFAITIVYLFFMIYLTDVRGMNPAFVGTLFLSTRLWDAFNDPMVGIIIDNTESRWGKFKPWILIGTILNAVVLVGLFSKPFFVTNMYVYISIMYVLWGTTYTFIDIPFWAMLPSIAKGQEDRTQLVSILGVFVQMAWLFVGAFGLTMIAKLSGGSEDPQQQSQGYFYLSVILATIFVITTVRMLYVLKTTSNKGTISKADKIGIKDAINIIKSNDQLLVYFIFVLLQSLAKGFTGNSSIYYFKYVIGDTNLFSFAQGFSGLITMSGLFIFPFFTKIVGKKNLFVLGVFLPVLGHTIFGLFSTFFPNSLVVIFIRTLFLGAGESFVLGSTILMMADVVDYGAKKLGSRNENVIHALRIFFLKVASSFTVWFMGISLSLTGYVANQSQPEIVLSTLKILMYVLPVFSLIGSYVFYNKYYKLYNDDETTT